MPSNTPNLSDALHTFDKSKQYKRVVFQQGKPILDVDLNDLTEAIESQTQSLLIEKMGFGPPQLDYRDWAIRSVDGDPTSTRNKHNIAFTLGRLDTRKGIVDTTHLKTNDPSKENSVVFDTYKLESEANSNNTDRLYANYILKGSATGGTTNKLIDDNKNFVNDMALSGVSYHNTITREYSTIVSQVNSVEDTTSVPFHINIEESACRVVFVGNVTASLTNVTRNITGVNGTALTLDGANLPAAPVNGDQYYVVPANTMEEYVSLYNATTTKAESLSEGLTGLPQLMPYVQVFEEDISPEEDSSIQSTLLGSETTHRTQLRWCIRIAKVKMSVDGDQYNSVNVGNLELSHVFTRFNSISEYEYQTMLDSVDATVSNDPAFFQTHFWKEFNQDGTPRSVNMDHQTSPYKDLGLSPMHFFGAEEMTLDRLMWGYLKAELLSGLDSLSGFNDIQILALFNSESKTDTGSPTTETLDPLFFPNKVRGTIEPIVHSFLSLSFPTDENFTFDFREVVPGKFKSPPKVFVSQADVGLDEIKSRSLFGYRGGLIVGPTSPLVFKSQSEHLAFLDQVVLGMSGLGSAQGITTQYEETTRLPSGIDYYLENTTTSLAQSGYGLGSINPISPISSAARPTGFLGGSSKYLLREKGNRTSHEVNWDDEDLGWSFYKKEDTDLRGSNSTPGPTDLTIRQWDEGPAQAVAFQKGINFRKLAIKTIAHKSMDLFTISEVPPNKNVSYFSSQSGSEFSAIGFQYPKGVNTTTSLVGLDSYSGVGSDIATVSSFKNSILYQPTTNSEYNLSPLINGYRPSSAMITHGGTRDPSNTDLSAYYGPWNRFDSTGIETNAGAGNPSNVPMDTWANRCTSMRLRYHIGDFYPGINDSRGIPANELVDSLNLFVRVEPLSLTHWMTMPKHQHSILENSFSMAEGIEALLKVSHGLGDTQKLINSSNQPLVLPTSPAQTVGLPDSVGTIVQADVGTVDALDLPFDYHAHPFVHWYHPAQHLITGPHPSGHRYSGGEKYTVYPKFGRRSMIIPALVPFEGIGDTDTSTSTPGTIQDLYDDRLSLHDDTNSELSTQSGTTMGTAVQGSGILYTANLDRSVFPYLPHSTRSDNAGLTKAGDTQTISYVGGSFTIRENSFVFPHVPQDNQSTIPGPVFIPASRSFAKQDFNESASQLEIGFYQPYLSENPYTKFPNDLTEIDGTTFPYDEHGTHYINPNDTDNSIGTDYTDKLTNDLASSYPTWSVPVLRAAIRTTTVASIVDLVRTSFTTALSSGTLSDEYSYTMPSTSHNASSYSNQTPGLGPDSPVDTLFAGDTGTATGGRLFRSGFMNPLNLGMGSYIKDLGLVSNYLEHNAVINDSFQYAKALISENPPANTHILDVFTALSRQGLQQKLLWNCSFRVLHHRPNGRTNLQSDFSSTAPKSITEVFLAHDRTENQGHVIDNFAFTGVPNTPNKKPYINLLATHPASYEVPGAIKFKHLYSMVSDSTGGSQSSSSFTDTNGNLQLNYAQPAVQTAAMGDTFAADPFDYAMSNAYLGNNNPMRATENTNQNSGIEIDLLSELNRAFNNKTALNLDGVATLNGNNFSLIDTMPSANELTLPGDHEIVFVLYTGHYGLKIHDTNDVVDVSHIPSVSGCHLTATVEVNRPSERKDSRSTDEHHYGKTVDGNPIKTYSILSSKE